MRYSFFVLSIITLLTSGCSLRLGPGMDQDSANGLIKPPALKKGDTILFIAPARARDEEPTMQAELYLEKMGYNVIKADNIHTRMGYLAGTDEERAHWIMQGFKDPKVKALFAVTGGYGSSRVLDMLDYDVIRRNPKILIGYSDITALHLAIQRKSGVVTFHSPMPTYMYQDHDDIREYAHREFWKAIGSEGEGKYAIDTDSVETPIETLVPGIARGGLTGGNLSLVAALMGTPYEMQTDGMIVFLEDIHEEPYRIDRMLAQLDMAGKLDHCAGVLLGRWRNCEPDNPEDSLSLDQVLDHYFADRPYPVVKNFPVGHVQENTTLPMGIPAELDATKGKLMILESPVVR